VRDAISEHVDTILDLRTQKTEATTYGERNRLQERFDEVNAEVDRL
jgi:hypothetical protein